MHVPHAVAVGANPATSVDNVAFSWGVCCHHCLVLQQEKRAEQMKRQQQGDVRCCNFSDTQMMAGIANERCGEVEGGE